MAIPMIVPRWRITLDDFEIDNIPCKGAGNVTPLVEAFGERSSYAPNNEGTNVHIKHPLNPGKVIIATLITE